MSWNSWFANNQSSLGQQNLQGGSQGTTGLSNVVTSTTATPLTGNTYYPNVSIGQGLLNAPYNPQYYGWTPPEKVLTIKEVALLHRMCGDDEEVRAVLNKILPHFRMEA